MTGQKDRIGWRHHNVKSVGPAICAEIQGLTGFKQEDPLLHRTFGAVITSPGGKRLDDLRLQSPAAKTHRFNVCVLTRHPSTPERWLADVEQLLRQAELSNTTTVGRWLLARARASLPAETRVTSKPLRARSGPTDPPARRLPSTNNIVAG